MFWKKNKFDFKIGDVVKFKDGTEHGLLKVDVSDWHGRIIEVDKDAVEVELDSITLRALTPELLKIYEERDEYPYLLTIPMRDIEPGQARVSEEEIEKTQDEIMEKIHLKEGLEKHEIAYNKWKRHFQRSDKFKNLDKAMRGHSDFVMETFYDYMLKYEGKKPEKWNVAATRAVLLNWVPNKISAEDDLFSVYGDIILLFMEFLEERAYLNTKNLQVVVANIKDEILTYSQNSSNWGPAKSFMMGAMKSGVDMDDKKAMDKYLRQQQLKALAQIGKPEKGGLVEKLKMKLVDRRQFRGIWQNQKVTVKYGDGKVVENVKFKDVKDDLLGGICELVKK